MPNLLLQKLPAPEFTVTTKIDFDKLDAGQKAGLLMMGGSYAYVAVERTSTSNRVVEVSCQGADKGGKEVEKGSAACATERLVVARQGERGRNLPILLQ